MEWPIAWREGGAEVGLRNVRPIMTEPKCTTVCGVGSFGPEQISFHPSPGQAELTEPAVARTGVHQARERTVVHVR